MHLCLVLDRERGELYVRGRVAGRSDVAEESERDFKMARARDQKAHRWLVEPFFDALQSCVHGKRPVEDARVRGDPNEPEEDGARQADFGFAAEQAFPPRTRTIVFRMASVTRSSIFAPAAADAALPSKGSRSTK
jgi:hypothetical protein